MLERQESGKSLRDALEDALATVEQGIARSTKPEREGFLMTSHIRQMLAAHPAEPAPVVTHEAVERTAAALWDEVWSEGKGYSEASDAERDECRNSARTILEAAAPLLGPRPLLDREAVAAKVVGENAHWPVLPTDLNKPYQVGIKETLDAVMEMARPMPTQTELTEWLREIFTADPGGTPWGTAAEELLALLTGAES